LVSKSTAKNPASFKYNVVAVGGTFDHLHKGHEALLRRAFETGKEVVIGLTTDDFAAKAGKKLDQDFAQRKFVLEEYLRARYPGRAFTITELTRNFGPGMFTKEIGALVVSAETAPKVKEANDKRRDLDLPDLIIETVPMVLAEDGRHISSTRIREGEIDEQGRAKKR
jgi:pantetheine-phosphate adenylyltransferase